MNHEGLCNQISNLLTNQREMNINLTAISSSSIVFDIENIVSRIEEYENIVTGILNTVIQMDDTSTLYIYIYILLIYYLLFAIYYIIRGK